MLYFEGEQLGLPLGNKYADLQLENLMQGSGLVREIKAYGVPLRPYIQVTSAREGIWNTKSTELRMEMLETYL